MRLSSTCRLLPLIALGAAATTAHADPNITLGGEYEFSEGVTAYTGSVSKGRTPVTPETILDERFLCTKDKSPVVSSWPLVSFTHDMLWGGEPRVIRTLEIVTGPVADGDSASVDKMGVVVTKLFRYLVAERTANRCDTTLLKQKCLISLKDILLNVPELTNEGCGGEFPAKQPSDHRDLRGAILFDLDDLTTDVAQINPQVTIGVKTAALIGIDADKLFGFHSDDSTGQAQAKLFKALQTEVRKYPSLDDAEKSRVLYAAYAVVTHLINEPKIKRNGDNFHDPNWKNAYGLYPKTSVSAVVKQLIKTVVSAEVYDLVVKKVAPGIDKEEFRRFWKGMRKQDNLGQAKPSDNTDVLLLEVRDTARYHITIKNMTNKDTLEIKFTNLKWD